MGGMAAFIPSRRDPEVNATALAKVREDKTRESGDGFDGSWVAHPDLVPLCKRGLRRGARRPAQPARPAAGGRQRRPPGPARGRPRPPARSPRRACATTSASALQYLATWLGGNGAVAIFNLMEDAATAEISRSQVWQWLHNGVTPRRRPAGDPRSGRADHRRGAGQDPRQRGRRLRRRPGSTQAAALFTEVALADDYAEFLTLPAYERDALAVPGGRGDAGIQPGPGAADSGPPRGTLEGNGSRAPRGDDDQALVPRMTEICGPDGVVTDPAELRTYECDGLTSHRAAPGARRAAARPRSRSRRWSPSVRRGGRAVRGPRHRAPACPAARCRRTDGRADRDLPDAPHHRDRPGQPAGDRRAGRHQPGGEHRGPAVRLLLRPRPVQPAGLLGGRQRGGELRRRALPQARLHRAPRHRAGDRHPGGRADLAGRRHRGGARLRPGRRVHRLRGHARHRHQDHGEAEPGSRRWSPACWPRSRPPARAGPRCRRSSGRASSPPPSR